MLKYDVGDDGLFVIAWDTLNTYVLLGTRETTFAEFSADMDYANNGNIVTEPFDGDADDVCETDVLVGYRGKFWMVDGVPIYYDAFDNAWAEICMLKKPKPKSTTPVEIVQSTEVLDCAVALQNAIVYMQSLRDTMDDEGENNETLHKIDVTIETLRWIIAQRDCGDLDPAVDDDMLTTFMDIVIYG